MGFFVIPECAVHSAPVERAHHKNWKVVKAIRRNEVEVIKQFKSGIVVYSNIEYFKTQNREGLSG